MSQPAASEPARASQPRGAATRERLLQSARALLARDGYEGTSIGDVAREAGVGVGTVYHHFADKRALLLELLDREIDETGAVLVPEGGPVAQALRGDDFRGALAAGMRLIRAFWRSGPAIYVIAVDVARRDAEVAARCRTIEQRYLEATRNDLRIGLQLGRIRSDVDLEAAVVTVYRSFQVLVQELIATGDEAFAERLIGEYCLMLDRYLGVR